MNLFCWLRRRPRPFEPIMDDTEAITHDWRVVGDDLRRAMGQRITDEINRDPAEVERLRKARQQAREGRRHA